MGEIDGGTGNPMERWFDEVGEELGKTDPFDMPEFPDSLDFARMRGMVSRMRQTMREMFGSDWWPTGSDLNVDIPQEVGRMNVDFEGEGADRMCVVKCAMPNVKSEEMKVTLLDNVLTVEAQTASSHEEQDEYSLMGALRLMSYCRKVRLPADVDTSGVITPMYEKGVLTIRIPCPESQSSVRVLPVRVP